MSITHTSIIAKEDLAKFDAKALARIDALLSERESLDSPGLLSGNCKRINAITGPVTGKTVRFTRKASGRATLAPTAANIAKLTSERDACPVWEPGKRAALTRRIKAMKAGKAA